MTAVTLLAKLHELGVVVRVDGGRLVARPASAILGALRPELAAHRDELLALAVCMCPGCGAMDYLPLGAGWRRCWSCGARWGNGLDPGEPADVDQLAYLLTATRVLVTGSREWTDEAAIERELTAARPGVVIAGGAPGADRLAAAVASRLDVELHEFPADWRRHGRRAGILRNLDMLREGEPTRVLAFHDDLARSRGTAHMCHVALANGLPVRLVGHADGGELTARELTLDGVPARHALGAGARQPGMAP